VDLHWWPGANAKPWEWAWQPHPAVWLAVLAIALGYVLMLRRSSAGRGVLRDVPGTRRRTVLFGLGLAVLWLCTDWPLGTLAAGYLLSAHASQYLVICFIVAPLLLLGLPPMPPRARTGFNMERATSAARRRSLEILTHPAVALVTFALITFASFFPPVVDLLRPSAVGSISFVAVWLAMSAMLWWPVVGPTPHLHRLPYFVGLGYLFIPFVLPKAPGVWFTFEGEPLYDFYSLAPRAELSAVTDQHIAGFMLWLVGSVMILGAAAVLFFRWYDEDRRMARPDSLGIPANPEAIEVLLGIPRAWAALEQLVAIVDAALPAHHTGAELAFAVHGRRGGSGSRHVTLELRAALAPETEAALASRVATEYEAFLKTLPAADRDVVADRLGFRLIGYGSRVR